MVTSANQSQLPPNERRYKLGEVCDYYGISRRAIGNYVKQGLMRVEQLGPKLLFTTREEVQRMMRPVQFACISPVASQSEHAAADRAAQETRERFRL